ncbi:hypothetical protein WJX73_001311 [Symbiochloris irregularis]|uniref:Uncharacterized protein n=1 Tax=Symbiochloris irregularis TaxID=706552 RepID=A0AAW1PIN3_9CHLO
MPEGRQVPWRSWEEWTLVKTALWSATAVDQRKGIEQVRLWRARGKLPLSVDVTAMLLDLRGRHTSGPSQSDPLLRLQYSMALILLVNGITDAEQKGKQARSVAGIAETAGLPRVLVDVRHEATHRGLPSLALLQLAAESALQWLRTAYWDRQHQHLLNMQAKVITLLQEFMKLQADALSRPQQAASDTDDDASVDPSPPGSSPGVSKAQELRKRRRQLAADLKDVVHPCMPGLIAQALLQPGILESHADDSQSNRTGVWKAALHSLCRTWPGLLPLLLRESISLLSRQGQAKPPNQRHAQAQHLHFVATLVWDIATGPRNQSLDLSISTDQTAVLLACCLRALVLLPADAAPPADSGDILPAAQPASIHREVLQHLAERLTQNMSQTAAASDSGQQPLRKKARMAEAAVKLQAMSAPLPADNSNLSHQGMEAAADGEVQKAEVLLEQLQDKVRRKAQAEVRERWSVAKDWKPCAIGHLPGPLEHNGILPDLPLVCGLESLEQQQVPEYQQDSAACLMLDAAAVLLNGQKAPSRK